MKRIGNLGKSFWDSPIISVEAFIFSVVIDNKLYSGYRIAITLSLLDNTFELVSLEHETLVGELSILLQSGNNRLYK